jgi:hypothetical protein
MNMQQIPTIDIERSDVGHGSETHLHGRWLVLARAGWIAVTLTLVILNLIALPDTYGSYFTFPPSVLHELHRLGLSPTLYGILLTVENAPFNWCIWRWGCCSSGAAPMIAWRSFARLRS